MAGCFLLGRCEVRVDAGSMSQRSAGHPTAPHGQHEGTREEGGGSVRDDPSSPVDCFWFLAQRCKREHFHLSVTPLHLEGKREIS